MIFEANKEFMENLSLHAEEAWKLASSNFGGPDQTSFYVTNNK